MPDGKPRIPPVEDWQDTHAAAVLAKVPSRGGEPLNIFRVIATHPPLLRRWAAMGTVFVRESQLPPREREIVVLRTGWNCGSEYEFGQHTVIGRDVGLTDDEIRSLTLAPPHAGWSAGDADLIAMVDEICASDDVCDATWNRLRERWNDAELIELVMLVGYYRLVSVVLNVARVPLDPGTPHWPSVSDEP